MRSSLIVLGPALAVALAAHAVADEAAVDPTQQQAAPESAEIAGHGADATADTPAPVQTAATAPAAPAPTEPVAPALGPIGYDAEGRQGRIHVVRPGDTLWDISDAYLGTPWVWPSIWKDNPDVANPHRIYPGDRIWITPTEMRRVTPEEAASLLANAPASESVEPPPAAFEDAAPEPERPLARLRVSTIDSVGLVEEGELDSVASVVDSPERRTWLAQGDRIYIGLGEGETRVGERFHIVRPGDEVTDPDTGAVLGRFVEMRGWAEVVEVHPESSIAEIRTSALEVRRGDHVIPRGDVEMEIPVEGAPAGLEGAVAFLPNDRTTMGSLDVVVLNRGREDGVDVGSALEVFRPGAVGEDAVRHAQVALPDEVVAKLVVVRAQPRTSVAVVTHTDNEIQRGDRFRADPELAR